jgi:protein involved in temperature-dependent protein secretion
MPRDLLEPALKALRRTRLSSESQVRKTSSHRDIPTTNDTIATVTFSWITDRENSVPHVLSVVWMLSLALFAVHEIRSRINKMSLAISIAA